MTKSQKTFAVVGLLFGPIVVAALMWIAGSALVAMSKDPAIPEFVYNLSNTFGRAVVGAIGVYAMEIAVVFFLAIVAKFGPQ